MTFVSYSSKTYVLVLLSSSFAAFAFVGFDYFLMKILSVQFQKDPTNANETLSGVALGVALSIIVGGYISKRHDTFFYGQWKKMIISDFFAPKLAP